MLCVKERQHSKRPQRPQRSVHGTLQSAENSYMKMGIFMYRLMKIRPYRCNATTVTLAKGAR
ncbi:MAG: hypothetical protein A4E28_01296 [Methanocella sp. PtaU1.Bin125]|nr:MAG: hypothetical protein A4E28_01296 [Methanocella sp. PtaU1.Bin125]